MSNVLCSFSSLLFSWSESTHKMIAFSFIVFAVVIGTSLGQQCADDFYTCTETHCDCVDCICFDAVPDNTRQRIEDEGFEVKIVSVDAFCEYNACARTLIDNSCTCEGPWVCDCSGCVTDIDTQHLMEAFRNAMAPVSFPPGVLPIIPAQCPGGRPLPVNPNFPTTDTSASATPAASNSDDNLKIIIPVVASAVVLIVATIIGYCCWKRKQDDQRNIDSFPNEKQTPEADQVVITTKNAPDSEDGISVDSVDLHTTPGKAEIVELIKSKEFTRGSSLGRGQFGTVYLILLSNGTSLAAKVLSAASRSREEIKQDIQEVQTMRILSHPNVVTYYYASFSPESQEISLFMEYVPGGSLGALVRSMNSRLRENQGIAYVAQVLAGLAYLHSNGIIHRDIKGENVLVHTSGVCKISDFGSSKEVQTTMGAKTICGTPNWMAPEVILGEGKLSHNEKVDVWSLGALAVEVLNKGKPLWGIFDTQWGALYKIGKSTGMPDGIPDGLSENCMDFLSQCFTRDVDQRPTCEALRLHPWFKMYPALTRSSELSDIDNHIEALIVTGGESILTSPTNPVEGSMYTVNSSEKSKLTTMDTSNSMPLSLKTQSSTQEQYTPTGSLQHGSVPVSAPHQTQQTATASHSPTFSSVPTFGATPTIRSEVDTVRFDTRLHNAVPTMGSEVPTFNANPTMGSEVDTVRFDTRLHNANPTMGSEVPTFNANPTMGSDVDTVRFDTYHTK